VTGPTTYEPGLRQKTADKVLGFLLRHGKGPEFLKILTVKGRRTGQPHATPVAPVERDGDVWLVSPFGEVGWVRNLRAGGTVQLSRGKERTTYRAQELDAHHAVPVLRTYLSLPAERFVRKDFEITAESTDAQIESEAPSHPVFALAPAS
jgi:deazaflavin-dependent oxidoreductase (nitroreductase family)